VRGEANRAADKLKRIAIWELRPSVAELQVVEPNSFALALRQRKTNE